MSNALLMLIAPFMGVGLALALGLLIGIERGWSHRNDPDGTRVAGIRTFAILGLSGGMAGEAWSQSIPWLAILILAGAIVALLIGYWVDASRSGDISATTALVGILTLAIGMFAAVGQGVLASVIAAVAILILASRRQLHGWIGQLSEAEVQAIARFALITLAILPVLPNQAFGPFDAWNPRQLWLVVVFVSAISLGGYVAGKAFGPSRGILAIAAAGAIVSSTAVTGALAARLRTDPGRSPVLVAGIAIASAVMFVRVLILTALLAPFAWVTLAMLIGPAALVSLVCVVWLLRLAGKPAEAEAEALPVRNPFEFGPALLLAGLVMCLSLLGRWMQHQFGSGGLATVLTISGFIDVDSAIMTMGGLPMGSLDDRMAGLILAAPVLLNTLVKAGIAATVGGMKTGLRAAIPLLISVATALAALPFVWWWAWG